MTARLFVADLRRLLEPHANPAQAQLMAAYMKGHFPFLGLPRTVYQPLVRPRLAAFRPHATEDLLLEIAANLWDLGPREYQYIAGDLLDRYRRQLTPASLPALRELLITKSWWDSVDQLTGRVIGLLVLAHPALRREMDRWSRHRNFWLRRAAIIHQLSHGPHTDADRLFDYCRRNAADPEFFIRKAIGWALRQYARQNPEAVRAFLAGTPELAPLSRREALKHLAAE